MTPAPKDEWVNLNGLSFHYRDWGGSGQPIVLLHGLASTCHIWDMVAPILAEDNAVIALDQRGHGVSAKPDDGYDFATVSNDLLDLIRARNMERPIIVGHSWGADVALEFAVAYREIARGWIKGDTEGLLKLLFHRDTREVLGVHIIGEDATELIHIGQAVQGLQGTVDYFANSVFNHPTLAECYKVAALDGLNRIRTVNGDEEDHAAESNPETAQQEA